MIPSVQEKADQKFLEQLSNHPTSAGKMIDVARINENRIRTNSVSRGFVYGLGKKIIGYRVDIRKAGENNGVQVNLQVEHDIIQSGRKIVNFC